MSEKKKSDQLPPVLVNIGLPGCLQPHKQDRGNLHTEETLHFILSKVQEGETLTNICNDYKELPAVGYVRKWLFEDEKLKEAYFEAQKIGSEKILDELIDIADGSDKQSAAFQDDVQRSQLRISTRKYLLERWHRERYGERNKAGVQVNIDLGKAMMEGLKRVEEMGHVIDGDYEKDYSD